MIMKKFNLNSISKMSPLSNQVRNNFFLYNKSLDKIRKDSLTTTFPYLKEEFQSVNEITD